MTKQGKLYKFRDRLVVFIDILGFANHVSEAASSKSITKARQIDQALLDIKKLGTNPDSETHIFSDSAIISASNDPVEIEKLFRNLSILTWSLMTKGVWIRGGISFGMVSKDKNKPWGPAIVEAANTEAQIASFPRIALASSALDLLSKSSLLLKVTSVSRDQDGVFSLDAVRKGFEFCLTEGGQNDVKLDVPNISDLATIKKQLDAAFDTAVDNPEIFKKIGWLCRQWDVSAGSFKEESGQDFRTKYFDDYTAKDAFGNGIGVLRGLP